MAEITIGGSEETSDDGGAPEHPECDGEMEMTQVVRVDGASGMFWVCSDYSDETPVINKAGVEMDSLKLR